MRYVSLKILDVDQQNEVRYYRLFELVQTFWGKILNMTLDRIKKEQNASMEICPRIAQFRTVRNCWKLCNPMNSRAHRIQTRFKKSMERISKVQSLVMLASFVKRNCLTWKWNNTNYYKRGLIKGLRFHKKYSGHDA